MLFRSNPDTAHSPETPHPPTPSPRGRRGGRLNPAVSHAKRLRAEPTKAEAHLWKLLRVKRPCGTHWRRQVVIGGYAFDFGCYGLKILIEVDGGVHKLPEVQARDFIKSRIAFDQGFNLIRIPNEQVLDIETAQYFDY